MTGYERRITDFLGEFSDYMCFAEENVNLKREEARLYSEVSRSVCGLFNMFISIVAQGGRKQTTQWRAENNQASFPQD